MAITVGLDFGTHQTKICIENSNDPQRKTYEFISWGDDSLFLPSIIQVNKDYTLMYGRFDLSTCLYAKKRKKREKPQDIKYPPKPEILSKPVEPKYPKEPIKNVVTSGGMILQIPLSKLYGINEEKYEERSISEHKKWVRECQRLKWDYEKRYELWRKFRQERVMGKLSKPRKPVFPPEPSKSIEENYLVADDNDYKIYQLWKKEYDKIDIQYKESLAKYEKEKSEYEAKCEKWRKECRLIEQKYKVENELYENSMEDLPMIFRYFKQATFSYYNWNYELKSELLSVWYLAYLIFDLEERFGTDFSIQMGVPASKKTYSKLKRSATTILIQAYRLVEEVFKNDKEKFLATKLEDL